VVKEYDHVVVGRGPGVLAVAADPAEVAGVRWAAARSLVTDAVDGRYAPWLRGVLEVALSVIDRPRRA
jgi:isopentenyldiphosphate isomerase